MVLKGSLRIRWRTPTLNMNARELHDRILELRYISKRSYVEVGKILSELKGGLYNEAVGAMTWADYLNQPEIDLSVGEANRLIQIYEEFIVRLGYDMAEFANVPVKNAQCMLPIIKHITNKEEVDLMVEEALVLTQKDFRERMYDRKEESGEVEPRTYEYLIMKKTKETGSMEKVHDIPSEDIKKTFSLE